MGGIINAGFSYNGTAESTLRTARYSLPMKLLVFAHTPPPHHGQSYMVQMMLEGFGGDHRHRACRNNAEANSLGIECYHVNARVSKKLQEIGDFRVWKFLLLLGYCLQAIWCRFRYGVTNFYYIPAPGKKSALYRDWLVMFLCRPFFKRVILHWHASGLGRWLETVVQIRSRSITYRMTRQAELSIVLSNYGRADAEKLYPRRVAVVGNGIPDPCPEFTHDLLPRRRARIKARRLLSAGKPIPPELADAGGSDLQIFKVLFLGHCTRDKGLFEAVYGAVLAQQQLAASHSPLSVKLVVAGEFVHPDEETEFHQLCRNEASRAVEYIGFVAGAKKRQRFIDADGFCFPSYLESFGLVLVEAMAFGLPIVTTRCGAVPEVVGPDYPGLVDTRDSEQVADALVRILLEDPCERLRQRFERCFTMERHLANLAQALHAVEGESPGMLSRPTTVAVGFAAG
jgi:glycosyltransferase involved in cell wall biosynthesis